MLTVLEFVARDGSSPFAKWFAELDAAAAAKVTTAVRRMELGNFSNVKGEGWRRAGDPAWRGQEEGAAARHRNGSRALEGLPAAKAAGEVRMALTRAFKETIQARIRKDRKYRKELLREGVECLLAGDLETGKAILRDYINATIGFEELSHLTGRPSKSLMRMLGPRGNPQARNLFEVIGQLQRIEGLHFELSLRAAS
jgi:hypothetical protein